MNRGYGMAWGSGERCLAIAPQPKNSHRTCRGECTESTLDIVPHEPKNSASDAEIPNIQEC
jgi:hypothetical protein